MTTSIIWIYILKNSISNKLYVGQTKFPLKERWDHGWGYKSCTHLNHAINKYGKENFYYEILTIAHTQEIADYWERYFIEKYDTKNPNNGYNIKDGGSHGSRGPHSEETKRKIAETKKGKVLSEETKKKISASLIGSLNHNFGKPKTIEALAKQSVSMSGENNPHYGKPRPKETREKIAQAQSGEKSSRAKLTKNNVIEIIRLLKLGYSQRKIAEMFSVTQATIGKIHTGESWKDVER